MTPTRNSGLSSDNLQYLHEEVFKKLTHHQRKAAFYSEELDRKLEYHNSRAEFYATLLDLLRRSMGN